MRNESHEDEPRIDLGALDPDHDPTAGDRFVDAVMARVATRPVPTLSADPLVGIWSIMRSPAIAAGLLIAAALGALGVRLNRTVDEPQTIVQAIGVPADFLELPLPLTPPDSR